MTRVRQFYCTALMEKLEYEGIEEEPLNVYHDALEKFDKIIDIQQGYGQTEYPPRWVTGLLRIED